MTERLQLARPVMRRRARLDADKARLQPAKQREQLISPYLPPEHGLTLPVDAVDLEDVLRDVEADCGNLHVDGSFPLMVDDSTIMARLDAAGWGAVHLIKLLEGSA
jgi:hypothetical protein